EGIDIQGATNSTLLLPNLQFAQAGNYTVTVMNSYGSIQSSNAVLIVQTRPPCAALPDSAIGWWQGEGDGADQLKGNDGILIGHVTFGPGRVRQGFFFGGNGDAVSLGNPADLHVQNLTIEAWIRRGSSTLVSYGSGGNGVLFGFGSG